jgi:hypothetical protein
MRGCKIPFELSGGVESFTRFRMFAFGFHLEASCELILGTFHCEVEGV